MNGWGCVDNFKGLNNSQKFIFIEFNPFGLRQYPDTWLGLNLDHYGEVLQMEVAMPTLVMPIRILIWSLKANWLKCAETDQGNNLHDSANKRFARKYENRLSLTPSTAQAFFFFLMVVWFEIVFPFIRLVVIKFLKSLKNLVNMGKPVNLFWFEIVFLFY